MALLYDFCARSLRRRDGDVRHARRAGSFAGARGLVLIPVFGVAAAIADVRGLPIVPQIRRQVPEHWRRVLPLPVATLLYGVLLGLGFHDVRLRRRAVGACRNRLLRRVAPDGRAGQARDSAPAARSRSACLRRSRTIAAGRSVVDAMAQRPAVLSVADVSRPPALSWSRPLGRLVGDAGGATTLGLGTDPSASGTTVVWTSPTGGIARDEGTAETRSVPAHAAVGGSLIAWRDGETVHVARIADLSAVLDFAVPGVTAVAVSDTWLVTRRQRARRSLHRRSTDCRARRDDEVSGAARASRARR